VVGSKELMEIELPGNQRYIANSKMRVEPALLR